MDARNLNFAYKEPQNGRFSAPNVAFSGKFSDEKNFLEE